MGMQAEFNWYIVLKESNIMEPRDLLVLEEKEMQIGECYNFMKSDYRIYPMDTPLPLIYNGKCLGLGVVTNLSWKCNITTLTVQVILGFRTYDPIAEYYESSFEEYKKQQERIDDGGKIDLRNVANLATRKRF